MQLSAGDKLGPYEILAPIGVGGMGDVYKANDTRLESRRRSARRRSRPTPERLQRQARRDQFPTFAAFHGACPLVPRGRGAPCEFLLFSALFRPPCWYALQCLGRTSAVLRGDFCGHRKRAPLAACQPAKTTPAVVSRHSPLGLDRAVHRTVRIGARAHGHRPPRTGLVWCGTGRNHVRLWLHRVVSHGAIRHDRAPPEDSCVLPVGSLVRFHGQLQVMQAAFVRFHYIGYHDLFYPALDVLIVAGMLRDLIVDGRVNRVYLYVFPGNDCSAGLGHVPGAREPELVASCNAGDSRVMKSADKVLG